MKRSYFFIFKDKYWMHDLIREMGREIVSSEKPGKRSRLWDRELALNVIRQKQGTDQVLAINLRGCKEHLTGKEFDGMSNLRFLNLGGDGAKLCGKFRNFRTNLLRLRWHVMAYP
ncbi:hypothetical protein MLD38_037372 [Melastoma candidum]|uniref:Uncharacterized protein n=1 Tax=Melastoma candidum TaxID=119954 RepID=A0ACB9LNQ5_9MYRT|nr:hypothetical protein MLD38_037372 [Melastoma candidum]